MLKSGLIAFAVSFWLLSPAMANGEKFTFVSDNPDGAGTHAGTVEVTRTGTKDVYDVVWTIPEGSLKGLAIVDEKTDTVHASYALDGVPGLVVLKEQDDRTWSGAWYQGGKTGSEVWTPAR